MKRLAPLLVLLPLTVLGCGDDGPTSPSPQPFNQTLTGTVSVFGTTRHTLTASRAGNMTLRLTWADATVDLDLYLTPSSCTDLYSNCTPLLASDAATGTTETIARTVTSGETFAIFVDNLDVTRSQTYSLAITIQ